MSRLLSSTTPSFAQASYTPLRETRHSTESFPGEEDDDLDPDSISSPQREKRTRQHSRRSSRSIVNMTSATIEPNNNSNHVLASDSDSENENQQDYDLRKDGTADGSGDNYPNQQQQRQGSADSSSTIVSIDSNADDAHPPKYARESFEYSEPGHDREYGQGLPVEGGGDAGGLRGAIEGDADKGLWMQVRTNERPSHGCCFASVSFLCPRPSSLELGCCLWVIFQIINPFFFLFNFAPVIALSIHYWYE